MSLTGNVADQVQAAITAVKHSLAQMQRNMLKDGVNINLPVLQMDELEEALWAEARKRAMDAFNEADSCMGDGALSQRHQPKMDRLRAEIDGSALGKVAARAEELSARATPS